MWTYVKLRYTIMKMLLGFLAKSQHKQLLEHQMTVTVQISKIYQHIKIKEMVIPWTNQHNQSIRVTDQGHQLLPFFQVRDEKELSKRSCGFVTSSSRTPWSWYLGWRTSPISPLVGPLEFLQNMLWADTDTQWSIEESNLGEDSNSWRFTFLGSFFHYFNWPLQDNFL